MWVFQPRLQEHPALRMPLFSKGRQRVLAVLFGNLDRSSYANEVIALVQSGTSVCRTALSGAQDHGAAPGQRAG